jgi:RNA recognition motif-containing protein
MAVVLPTDRATGRPRGFAFVEFADREGAELALETCDGRELDGHAVRLSWARERDEVGEERARRGPKWRNPAIALDDEEAPAAYGGREPSGSRRDREGADDEEDQGGRRRRHHGKHGSDRKRGRGTRRVIE